MRYGETRPAPAAAALVAQYWTFEAGALPDGSAPHVIPPDGLVSVWLSADGGDSFFCGVTGPSEKAHRTTVHDRQRLVGARLQPGAGAPLFGAGWKNLIGTFLPLAEMAPGLAPPFSQAAAAALNGDWRPLDDLFANLSQTVAPADPVAREMALRLIETDGAASIAALAADAGLSTRQARRRFQAAVGLSPKSFARLRRVRRACADAIRKEMSFADVSLEAGFADQAHLSRNFQSVFDQPPGKVRALIKRIIHGEILDMR